jgi:hypothetical protein
MGAPNLTAQVDGLLAIADTLFEDVLSPAKMSDEDKLALIATIRDGAVLEVAFAAVVWWDKPNHNAWRFAPETLDAIVADINERASRETPIELPQFLLDHGMGAMANVGHVTAAKIVADDDGVRGIAVRIAITDAKAQEAFVRGRIDRFSAGSHVPTSARCSICDEATEDTWWRMDCGHRIGAELEDGRVAELLIQARFKEASATAFPAVEGTFVLSTAGPAVGAATEAEMPNENTAALTARIAELEAAQAASEAEKAETAAKVAEFEAAQKATAEELFKAMTDPCIGVTLTPSDIEGEKVIFEAFGAERYRAHLAAKAPLGGKFATKLSGNASGDHDAGSSDESGGGPNFAMLKAMVATKQITKRDYERRVALSATLH